MNQTNPHKHAAIIKAWADGAEVEYKTLQGVGFVALGTPYFEWGGEYRIKPAPDEFAELKAAVAAGKSMQTRLDEHDPWIDANNHLGFIWNLGVTNYRVKPETVSYRVAILQNKGSAPYISVCHFADEKTFEAHDSFIRWAGERVTVEV